MTESADRPPEPEPLPKEEGAAPVPEPEPLPKEEGAAPVSEPEPLPQEEGAAPVSEPEPSVEAGAQPAAPAEPEPPPAKERAASSTSQLRVGALVLASVLGMVLLMAWLAGAFHEKIQPTERPPLPPAEAGLTTLTLEPRRIPWVREVTGTIAAEHETVVASELLARVAATHVSPGQRVPKGAPLVTLEEAELRTRLQQAQALLVQAEDTLARIEKLHQGSAASEQQLVRARTDVDAAQARVREADAFLDKTRILAPSDGVVIERRCEVGDTVTPGAPLVRLYDRLQLNAVVPESLQPHLRVGQQVAVRIDALGEGECTGEVTEVVPQAQAISRSFRVKVSGPCPPGLIPGMFGRMRIPLGEREVLRIPAKALRRVGQISMAFRRLPDGRLLRQFVRTGEADGDEIEITSGLRAGDEVVADAASVGADAGAP